MKSGFRDAVNWRAVGAHLLFYSFCAFLFVAGLAGTLVEPVTRVPAPASVISLSSLTVNPTSVNGGIPSIGTVVLSSAAPVGGAQVVLSSNNPAAGVPSDVTVPAGSNSANFTVSTAPVSAPTVATISASYGGVTQSATLDVTPPVAPGDLGPFVTSANVTVSSQNTATGQLGIKAFDGIIDGSPGDPTKEWASSGQLAGAWIQVTGPRPVIISKVILNDRPNLQDNVLSGTLSFSDASNVPVSPLPNDGSGLLVTFPPKTITWIRFTVTSAVGSNIGLAEFQVFAPPLALSSLTLSPTSVLAGYPPTGVATLNNPAPPGGADVVLSSSNPLVASVTQSVKVFGGNTSASFGVSTPLLTAPTRATISGSYGGVTQSATLDITPPVAPGDLGPSATSANVTVSSQNIATGQQGIKAFDGIIDGSPGDPTKEWATLGQLAGAWIQLTGSRPGTISKVILNDRPNLQDNVLSGALSFSDGSIVPAGPLPNDGTGLLVTFPPKTVTWVRFTVTSAVGSNIGLAEFQVFATSTAVSPRVAVVTFTQTQQFQADFASKIVWSVDGIAGGNSAVGTISPTGLYTPPSSAGAHTVQAGNADQPSQVATARLYVTDYPGLFTQHNDNARTGQNLQETVLTPDNVNSTQFGKLSTLPVDGNVYAQPLYVENVLIPERGYHNIVFVATEHDSVYAFDADNPGPVPLWRTTFIDPAAGITTVSPIDVNADNIYPEIGITSTPVFDPANRTLYVASKTKENGNYFHRLHALDITTGAEKYGGPVVIQGSVLGTGDGSSGGEVAFDALKHLNRPGLLLLNGVVYIAFGSHDDNDPYHGWVFAYDGSTLQQIAVFNATPNGSRAGIWQGGSGIASDALGNVYVATGNGTFDANVGGLDYGDSVLKLKIQNGTLTVLDYFTPADQDSLNAADLDFGSGGPLVLPDQPGPYPHLLTIAGKKGTLYLLNRDNLGRFNAGGDSQVVQFVSGAFTGGGDAGVFGSATYWNSQVYCQAGKDLMKDFPLVGGLFSTPPIVGTDWFQFGRDPASVSANGSAGAILWVLQTDNFVWGGPVVLHAYDATNLSRILYTSQQAGSRDVAGPAVKFSVPTVANGKVFVGTQNALIVYGLLP